MWENMVQLTSAKRREWMGLGVARMIITSDDWDHSRKFPAFSTSKLNKSSANARLGPEPRTQNSVVDENPTA